MYEKFGEFDSWEEINKAAQAQLEEGDLDAIKEIAKENGLDPEDVEDFCTGTIEELTTPTLAAIGKLDAEAQDLKIDGVLKDWKDFLVELCTEDESMSLAVRRKGKTLTEAFARILKEGFDTKARLDDRIEDRETYICFLRRQSAPGVPFYTIEVEPGGTIRQHRSYLDEEPGIEEIRGFLREWQKVLKSRLTWKDRELARTSRIKREQNIEELKAKRNTRVLKGLEEDFLEAEAAGWN